MEALQFSQILADLSTLQSTVRPPLSRSTSCPPPPTPNTGPSSLLTTSSHASSSQEPSAAAKLLNANNQLSQSHLRKKSKGSILPEPPRFDKLGRRIIRGPVSGTASPKMMPAPLSRMSSSFSALSSGTTTPNKDGGGEPQDEDMARAKKLLELYQMRGKFQQIGESGITRSQQRVDKVMEVYTNKTLEEKEKAARAKYT